MMNYSGWPEWADTEEKRQRNREYWHRHNVAVRALRARRRRQQRMAGYGAATLAGLIMAAVVAGTMALVIHFM